MGLTAFPGSELKLHYVMRSHSLQCYTYQPRVLYLPAQGVHQPTASDSSLIAAVQTSSCPSRCEEIRLLKAYQANKLSVLTFSYVKIVAVPKLHGYPRDAIQYAKKRRRRSFRHLEFSEHQFLLPAYSYSPLAPLLTRVVYKNTSRHAAILLP